MKTAVGIAEIWHLLQVIDKAAHRSLHYHNEEYPNFSTANLKQPWMHPGAERYYNKNQPNFLVQYAELMGLLLSLGVLVASGLWQLRLWLIGKQKNRADMYNLQLLELIEMIQKTQDLERLNQLRQSLFVILQAVVIDLDKDRISPESFQSFTLPWEVAITSVRHRENILLSGS